ncbi:putative protein serine/threonine kinase [Cavenderia fasciculata]|uniref:non-specific serine/threonine protein kinase n=1 Tax=Cavenderia fasciculata TaxID=261658 RepID=F4PLJ6_CACFS|nr:putative protein serine/threonine kinase [Cavenderia fasciculata]EGG23418.1 putative protein serine/threonine kinase [Cavenderia fasciculata]|eukprot:XP_004361269.1 putative protein serine/threonine kinase [Cavenderia fasciculata]
MIVNNTKFTNSDPFASTPTKQSQQPDNNNASQQDIDSTSQQDDMSFPNTQLSSSQTTTPEQHTTGGNDLQQQLAEEVEKRKKQKEQDDLYWGELLSLGEKLQSVSLKDESLVLGRLKSCNVQIAELVVSAKHCRLFRNNDSIFIQDLSTNGTYLNGKPIGRGNLELIKNGDRISLAGASQENQLSYIFKDLKSNQSGGNGQQNKQSIWDSLAKKEIFKEYDLIGELGRGNFSTVYLGVNKSRAVKVAVKDIDLAKYQRNPRYLLQLEREVEILKATNHPNIISIYDIFQSDLHLYIVMELATGGELYEKLANDGSFCEDDARLIFNQLLDAVNYLHVRGIAHRDLKPENILFDSNEPNKIKLADFGLARVIGENELARTLCGTPLYVAPEVIVSKSKNKDLHQSLSAQGYGFSCDAWSLGAILYILLSGEPPFFDDTGDEFTSTPQIFEQICTGSYGFPEEIWADISVTGRDLVKKLLTVNPQQRITVKDALNHPWITQQSQHKRSHIDQDDDDYNNNNNNNNNSSQPEEQVNPLKKKKTILDGVSN